MICSKNTLQLKWQACSKKKRLLYKVCMNWKGQNLIFLSRVWVFSFPLCCCVFLFLLGFPVFSFSSGLVKLARFMADRNQGSWLYVTLTSHPMPGADEISGAVMEGHRCQMCCRSRSRGICRCSEYSCKDFFFCKTANMTTMFLFQLNLVSQAVIWCYIATRMFGYSLAEQTILQKKKWKGQNCGSLETQLGRHRHDYVGHSLI